MLCNGLRLKPPPGAKAWSPEHWLPSDKPRHRYNAAECVARLKVAFSPVKTKPSS